jgi:hypothetical protein
LAESVDAFILDTRDSYMGKAQARWLRHKLENSHATWKLVFVGFPVSVRVNSLMISQSSSSPVTREGLPTGSVDDGLGTNSIVSGAPRSPMHNDGSVTMDTIDLNSFSNIVPGSVVVEEGAEGARGIAGSSNRQVQISSSGQAVNFDAPDDLDENGRNKYGLPYIIGSLQAKLDASVATSGHASGAGSAIRSLESLGLGSDGDAKISLEGGSSSLGGAEPPRPDTGGTEGDGDAGNGEDKSVGSNTTDEDDGRARELADFLAPDQKLQKVESGIVFITSGVEAPFIAALDTSHWNRAYCLEIGVGSPVTSRATSVNINGVQTSVHTSVEQVKELEPTFLFGGEHLFYALDNGRPVTSKHGHHHAHQHHHHHHGHQYNSMSAEGDRSTMKPTPMKSCCALSYDPVEDTLNVKIVGSRLSEDGETADVEPTVLSNFMLYVPHY